MTVKYKLKYVGNVKVDPRGPRNFDKLNEYNPNEIPLIRIKKFKSDPTYI